LTAMEIRKWSRSGRRQSGISLPGQV